MKIQVKLFAAARQLAGSDVTELELPDHATVGDVRSALIAQMPELTGLLQSCLFSVDAEFAGDQVAISAESDIACIPPVSGG